MTPDEELTLVRRALTCGLSNCVEWINDRTALRVRNDPENQGLTPEAIKRLVREYVEANPQAIEQRHETRDPWRDHRLFWYCVVVPVEGFHHGLFVEIALSDEDPDCPCVQILNAHSQRR
jgi:hypothetical protein